VFNTLFHSPCRFNRQVFLKRSKFHLARSVQRMGPPSPRCRHTALGRVRPHHQGGLRKATCEPRRAILVRP